MKKDQFDALMKVIKQKDQVKAGGRDLPKTEILKESPPLPPEKFSDAKIREVKKQEMRKKLSWWDRRKLKRRPETSFLVTIRFSNGTKRSLVVTTDEELFTYRKRSYYLRYEDAVLNLNLGLFELVYDEDHAVPLGREVVMREDDDETEEEFKRAYFQVTPSNVKAIVEQNYIKVLAESQDIQRYLKLALFLGIMNAVLLLFLVFTQLQESGVLNI